MIEIIMPKVGDAMTEGKVVRWYKKAGDSISKGEPLLEIETDKVNLDLEAEGDGILGDLEASEGQMIPVGGVVAHILAAGEKASDKPAAVAKPEPAAAEGDEQQRRATDRKDSIKHTTGEYAEAIETKGPRRDKAAPQGQEPSSAAGGEKDDGRRRSSPLARRMAKDLGVPLDALQGSGPRGRIVAKDVESFRGASTTGAAPRRPATGAPPSLGAPPPLEEKSVPLSAMRRTIAKRLAESTGPIPHFYLTADFDVSSLVSLRQQLADIEGAKISLNDFIIRATALALRHHPNVNASWGDDAIALHGEVHVGVAVSTTEGLITPVIRNADQKTIPDIAHEVRALAEKAKNRKLLPSEYQGSTLTISNLGAWGIEEFTAIINPPNAAILAIGAAEARAVVVDRQIVIRDRMKVTMSCDHRVIDGAAGAEFLKTLRVYVEQPLRLVV
jgi:pyruvate dehydrogenase E2 component (dihydrolipoyllysine-residue acetyltransferase)